MQPPSAYCFYMMSTARAEAMVAIGGGVEHGQSSLGQPMHARRAKFSGESSEIGDLGVGHMIGLREKVHCRSLSSIHKLYNHAPVEALASLLEGCEPLVIFYCPEVVRLYSIRSSGHHASSARSLLLVGSQSVETPQS